MTPTNLLSNLLQTSDLNAMGKALGGYLPQQRWFGGKSRGIASASISSSIMLPGTEFALSTVDVQYSDGSSEVYQLPLGLAIADAAEALHASAPKAVITTLGDDGIILYDASANPEFRERLLRWLMETAQTQESAGAALGASLSPSFESSALEGSRSKVGSAEQSNTSIMFGAAAILKLFRRLQPSENPDVEICRFLTDVAHFRHIPAYFGELHRSADGATLAFLQAFAANQGDGWAWFTDRVAAFYASVAGSGAPAALPGPASFLGAPEEYNTSATGDPAFEETVAAAALLGTRTAELHIALATPTDNPAFGADVCLPADIWADSERFRDQVELSLAALERSLPSLSPQVAGRAAELLARREDLLARAESIEKARPEEFGRRIRIHGDYHLGQLLRTADDFVMVDFEGEPARPLEERREKQSPLRDVAGMLRSFSYAAYSALERMMPTRDAVESGWAELWENAASSAFLQAYAQTIMSVTSLVPNAANAQALLEIYVLEKSLYELLYELNNRPAWTHIPLNGILALLGTRA